jgi:hypothetical protein
MGKFGTSIEVPIFLKTSKRKTQQMLGFPDVSELSSSVHKRVGFQNCQHRESISKQAFKN